MANFCPNCGAPIVSGTSFCPNCGYAVNSGAPMSGPSGYQQPGYQQPSSFYTSDQQQQVEPIRRNGIATAGFVLSLLGLIFFWFPIVNFFLLLPGLVLSIIGVFRVPRGKAIAGLIMSTIAIASFFIMIAASRDYARWLDRIFD